MAATEDSLKVVVVEDHELLLDTLVVAFEDLADFQVVATASSVDEFERVVADPDLAPDVVVTDVDLRGRSGREVAELTARLTSAEVLVITGQSDEAGVRLALDTGAAGFVSKTAPLTELVDAVRSVAGGSAVFPAKLLRQSIVADSASPVALTDREQEVLEHLARGRATTEIAAALHISAHTVRNHVRALLRKLDARSQLEAVVNAVRAGQVEIR